ncbi:SPOR domain-containing protein [Halomonas sp. SSL-5]|uniref:SPOR domain-containing protein n=1 Tax=Halomonas sp. SSL-5 TaxID=3065855 RepID=UPI002738BEF3|nr:SPOR domain-containing protein [Halomonas sp. SSL-5]MDY7115233.1 SPOR domain-containing protein [Halomonas sp. SSL-5]
MKYGMRERLSGAVILIALAVIFVPMLFDEPAPRDERPEPVLSIDAPIDVERHDVPEPVPPASLSGSASSDEVPEPAPRLSPDDQASPEPDPTGMAGESPAEEPAAEPAIDPIAELARAADQRLAETPSASGQADAETVEPAVAEGEWAVQVGSFGEPANVERLLSQLRDEGFSAYSRPRGNDLTTVYVGPFASSEAGERAVAEVKARINLQGLLVRVRE